ncbi:MAG TPA: carbon-nitrogen family hydrolase [Acidothermaceae bacterium]
MRIALLQLRIDDSEPASDRIARVLALVKGQAGADLVVLPELWVPGAFGYRGYQASATALPGVAITSLAAIARDIGVHILAGTVIEQDGDELHNTAVLISPAGEVVYTYRKVHLFGFDRGEAEMLTPGDDISAYAMPGFTTLGMTTCYDLRFPELYRLLLDAGAQLVVIPAGWPAARLDHWLLLLRARALEDQLFVVGCNQVGTQEGVELAGHSVVVDPWGRIIAEAGTDEEVLLVDIDLAMVSKIRAEFPVLRDRRLGLPAAR